MARLDIGLESLYYKPSAIISNNRSDTVSALAYVLFTTVWNDKIVVLKKTTLQLYFKTFIEKINSGNFIM